MNRTDIVRALHNQGVKDADATLEKVLDIFTLGLIFGEDVTIRNWGRMQVRHRRPVIRLNPRTGDPVAVPETRTVSFVPAPALKRRLNRKG